MLDFLRYLLERNAKEVSSKASRSSCVVHRTGTLRCIVDPNLDTTDTRAQADRPQADRPQMDATGAAQSGPENTPGKKKV
ncbi:hypothetical protein [Orrella marina]|uniref:Uncharacterized protein n=1 Tax=Orrella marina TaxID=2163011 RepID=A0A2R4XFB7_9BURK|nr:hypothetical protein [Orrella marina]AWB32439.1 hypothetical protein DBV39_00505 [Orrella marina]